MRWRCAEGHEFEATEVAVADRELRNLLGDERPALTSVYVGGGTPTLLEPRLLATVLAEIRRRFDTIDDLEVSVEANPDGLRESTLEAALDRDAAEPSQQPAERAEEQLALGHEGDVGAEQHQVAPALAGFQKGAMQGGFGRFDAGRAFHGVPRA